MLILAGVRESMIITYIIPGTGIGNQLFIYAAGLSVATRLNTELILGSWDCKFSANETRDYYLSRENFPAITERDANFQDIKQILSPAIAFRAAFEKFIAYKPIRRHHIFRRVISKLVRKLVPNPIDSKVYHYPTSIFSSKFENIPDNTCIKGYFVSEKFFMNISDLVRKKLKFADSCFNPELSQKIKSCNSVALHVRRGDKLNNSELLPSTEYYMKASIEKIYSLTSNPEFFVFSDDINYCRENLPKIYPDAKYNFIDGQTPHQDMALMTICKHVIIAPSTFSWWGAWLNENPNKIVIAPDVNLWIKNFKPHSKAGSNPEGWIKIK